MALLHQGIDIYGDTWPENLPIVKKAGIESGMKMELPITAAPAPGTKMAPEPFVVTDENVEQLEDRFAAMSQNNPDFKRLGDALHRYMIG